MSSKNKDSRDSPKSTASKAKDAIASGQNQRSSTEIFQLGAAMTGSMRNEDVHRIMSIQNKSLKNFAKTNELLGKFNDFSSSKYDVLQHMFLQHTRLLVDLKKDLTNVFLRIRRLKVRLQKQYPDAFEGTFNLRQDLEKRLEKEDAIEPTYVSSTTEKNMNKKGKMKNKKANLENKGTVTINDKLTGLQCSEGGEINNDLNLRQDKNTDLVKDEEGSKGITGDIDDCQGIKNSTEIKKHTIDKTELTEDFEKSDLNVTSNKVEREGVSGDEMSFEHFRSEVKIIENGKDGNGSTDLVEDESKRITRDIEDCQGIKDHIEIQNTSGVIDEISMGITDREEMEGGLEGPPNVDNGCPNKLIEEDLEGKMGSSKDISDCQRIQGSPELRDSAYVHSSEETAKDISG